MLLGLYIPEALTFSPFLSVAWAHSASTGDFLLEGTKEMAFGIWQ